MKEPQSSDAQMSLGEHIDELRHRLIRVLLVLVVAMIGAFLCKEVITFVAFAPMQPTFITAQIIAQIGEWCGKPDLVINAHPLEIINTKMAGQFNLHFKMAFFVALVLTIPYLLWEVWLFVRPAMDEATQRMSVWLVWQCSLLFLVGLSFGYLFITPLAVNFLGSYSLDVSISNMIEMGSYLSLLINTSFAAALIFQLPLLVRMLAMMGLVTSTMMRQYRRYAIAMIVILAAVITPPDVVSQLLIAIPLYLLYEWSIGIARKIENKKNRDYVEEN